MPPPKQQQHQDSIYQSGPQKANVTVWVSDQAYAELVSRATAAGYVNRGTMIARGLMRYIQALFDFPGQQWRDTRPPHLIERSIVTLNPALDHARRHATRNYGRAAAPPQFPFWWDPDEIATTGRRIERQFHLNELPATTMTPVALTLGVTSPRRHDFQFEPHLMAGNLLEAIGLGHLTPAHEPSNPRPAKKPRQPRRAPKYREMVW